MSIATASLPSDPAELRTFAASLQAEYDTLKQESGTRQAEMQREIAARDAELYAKSLHIAGDPSGYMFDHCCPARSRTESTGCWNRVNLIGNPRLGMPVKWALFQKA
jgi:hypothetical protein